MFVELFFVQTHCWCHSASCYWCGPGNQPTPFAWVPKNMSTSQSLANTQAWYKWKQLQLYANAVWICLLFHYQVLPSFVDKHDALLLRELILMWSNYKLMTKWLCKFFESIDRHFVPKICYCSLTDISNNSFHDLVKIFVIFCVHYVLFCNFN